jgi:hypothetical protein
MSSPAKILRGCSFPMFVTSRHRPRSHISTGAAAYISSPLGKDPNHPSDSKVSHRIGRTGPCRRSLTPWMSLVRPSSRSA